jgi:hypothetical protein
MSFFSKMAEAADNKKQSEWEARLAQYQANNYFNKPSALIKLPTPAYERYIDAENKAWYEATGAEELYRFYATRMPPQFIYNTNQFYRVSRGSDIPALHYNLAQIITKTMANLIFSKDVAISIQSGNKASDKKFQFVLDKVFDDNSKMDILRKAAETESYSGAVGFRFVMDPDQSDCPIMQIYPRSQLEVRRKYDRIYEICFKDYYPVDGETNPFVLYSVYGKGYIRYEMYQETWDPASQVLQMQSVALDKVPACSNLKSVLFVDENGKPSNMIFAAYKENKDDARSDYYGVIDDFIFLDELYSNMADFMRKSKIKTYLHDNSLIKEEDTQTGALKTIIPNSYDTSNIPITDSNPNWQETEIKRDVIEVKDGFEGYTQLFEKTLAKTLSTVGLSINTVLMNHENYQNDQSGTALSIKEKASIRTRDDKINRWSKTLKQLARVSIMLYTAQQGSENKIMVSNDLDDNQMVIRFPEYEELDQQTKLSIITQKLNAGLMTKEDAMQQLYPDLTKDQIEEKLQ